jgi:dsRNA-specific ribonuclease
MAVESVLGGIFSQFGSPAAHRAFHTLVLPYLSDQVRDQALKAKIEEMRVSTEKLSNGGILLP